MTTEIFNWLKSKGLISLKGELKVRFEREYLNMTPDQAYNEYLDSFKESKAQSDLVAKLEAYLISKGFESKQSNISESRYYNINGLQLRFSSHVYPTGSMTSHYYDVNGNFQYSKIDLCADRFLINEALSILNINL